jgi:cell division control protein 6
MLRFGEMFKKEATRRKVNVRHVYLNPKVHGSTRTTLYRYLTQQATPEVFSISLSAEELLIEMVRNLQQTHNYLLISFDEVDYYVRHVKNSIYDLTRLNEITPGKPSGVLGVIFAARNTKFYEKLDKSELSTLGSFPINFPNYSTKQIYDILEVRIQEAFQDRAVNTDVLEYIADISSKPPTNGDIRYALGYFFQASN